MAQQLQSINLVAPAFKGVNTEDSPIGQDFSFADVADNAVIDKRGRIASRKGFDVLTTTKTELGLDSIRAIKEFEDSAGNKIVFSVGNNKILSGTTTLVDETPSDVTINSDNWKMINFNDSIYFFQRGYKPLTYPGTGVNATKVDELEDLQDGTTASVIDGANEGLAAFGRLWCADFNDDKSTIYWSDLLIGTQWLSGTSGSINISKVWPDGYDEIVALASHNGLLIIFGRHSIVAYQGAEDPATMSLADTISGVGCVDRDTLQYTGTDVLFLSHTGLKSFGRTIQEKSMPISSFSGNVTKDIIQLIQGESDYFRTVYSPEEGFYLLTFVSQNITYCFDVRGTTENGSYRVTRWPGTGFTSYTRKDDGTLLIGNSDGISEYDGYTDNGSSFRFKYYSPGLTFGDPSRLKILKKLRPTIVGASNVSIFLKWAYDFESLFNTQEFTIGGQTNAYFNESEYTVGEFTPGELTSRRGVNTTGGGGVITIGLEADINGSSLSLQEINVLALMGKVL